MFIIGILIFAGASLAGGFATDRRVLLVVPGAAGCRRRDRLAHRAGPGDDDVRARDRTRNRAFGVYAAVSGAGAAIGLILGGVLTSSLSWRWVLFVNVPIGMVLAHRHAVRPARERARTPGGFDLPGAITSTLGVR